MYQVYHTVQHELSYCPVDWIIKLYQTVFRDADVMNKLSWGRTKAESIVPVVLALAADDDDSLGVLHRNLI
jgi:hypothetical protein